ncbi:MAG: fumarylacetoacetate hydrolase family protein [Bacteroidaceae bacterium]|nr:fumarylacetoacetate hydrolase family protein [Bacteroidaceae bacterium]
MKFIASSAHLLQAQRENALDNVFYTLPDTALRQGGQPFFVPDEGTPCEAYPCVAVRVCRQGRSISPRFAHRYYDAYTAAVHFVMAGQLSALRSVGAPWTQAVGFDGAACLGRFVELPAATDGATASMLEAAFHFSATCDATAEIDVDTSAIDTFVAQASRYFTLHQGDVLLLGEHPAQVHPARLNTVIKARVGGTDVLAFNVK